MIDPRQDLQKCFPLGRPIPIPLLYVSMDDRGCIAATASSGQGKNALCARLRSFRLDEQPVEYRLIVSLLIEVGIVLRILFCMCGGLLVFFLC
jgi:hypothetical protein